MNMNTLIHYVIPSWIAPLFLMVIFIPAFLVSNSIRKSLPDNKSIFIKVIAFFSIYFLYVGIASLNGVFDHVFLPPLVLLYCTFPFAFFLFGVVMNMKWYKAYCKKTPLHEMVRLHSFRLIGFFFLLFALYNALPKFFAIIAGLGDMITALTSIYVARLIQKKRANAKGITFLWNCFGFIDILFTAVTAILLTKLSIDNGTMGVDTLARFPFCYIPAFAPPLIIFMHVTIFKKMRHHFLENDFLS
jgi:hypothetical protein